MRRKRFIAGLIIAVASFGCGRRGYDLGYFDDETCRSEPIENPFGSKLLPIRSE